MFKGLLSVFLKSNCPLCQRSSTEIVCQSCEKQLLSCRHDPARWWQGDLPLFAWGSYQGKLKRAIATMKYNNSPQLGELFGYWLGETWRASPLRHRSKLTIVPIPLHASKLEKRGFNQAEIIAKSFCQITGDRLQSKVLERVRSTEAMFGLNYSQRQTNLIDAFQVSSRSHQHLCSPILLVDDIYTTGTTVREAAKVLRENKAVVCGVAAIAAPEQLNYEEG
jgi:ComF family protein